MPQKQFGKKKIPQFLQPYLASYNLRELDISRSEIRQEVITRLLNLGDKRAIEWAGENFSKKELRQTVKRAKRGSWYKRSLDYWVKILHAQPTPQTYQRALIKLEPQLGYDLFP